MLPCVGQGILEAYGVGSGSYELFWDLARFSSVNSVRQVGQVCHLSMLGGKPPNLLPESHSEHGGVLTGF